MFSSHEMGTKIPKGNGWFLWPPKLLIWIDQNRIAVRLKVSVWGPLPEHLGCHAPNFCDLLGGRSFRSCGSGKWTWIPWIPWMP